MGVWKKLNPRMKKRSLEQFVLNEKYKLFFSNGAMMLLQKFIMLLVLFPSFFFLTDSWLSLHQTISQWKLNLITFYEKLNNYSQTAGRRIVNRQSDVQGVF